MAAPKTPFRDLLVKKHSVPPVAPGKPERLYLFERKQACQ